MTDMTPQIRNGIFAGESGGDYNALFGYQNRLGGRYADTPLTAMTVDQALQFADPSGDYGQWVKGQIGRVATPMGAYQIVGSTLRDAKAGLGLRGDEVMSRELQDALGNWIYQQQGTGAWAGYRGPREAAPSAGSQSGLAGMPVYRTASYAPPAAGPAGSPPVEPAWRERIRALFNPGEGQRVSGMLAEAMPGQPDSAPQRYQPQPGYVAPTDPVAQAYAMLQKLRGPS